MVDGEQTSEMKKSVAKNHRTRGWHFRMKRFYERHRYDFVFFRRLEKRAILPWLNFKPQDRVCELGSFNGANARAFAQRYGCSIYGLDIRPHVVQLAQSFNNTARTCFLVGSAEALPFGNETFDKIYGV